MAFSPLAVGVGRAWAKLKKTILPVGTRMADVINRNPRHLDTRHLKPIPLSDFGTMGLTDYEAQIQTWRLEVSGAVQQNLRLSYGELLKLAPIEREVLLICPGVFANHGRWRGISVMQLLETAGLAHNVQYVDLRGPAGPYENRQRFPIDEIRSHQVFLAYAVNGQTLPRQHGFPLRTVAEGYYGFDWIKYVYKVEAVSAKPDD
jgi:sulfoxide reductase catalytic subunit YedY